MTCRFEKRQTDAFSVAVWGLGHRRAQAGPYMAGRSALRARERDIAALREQVTALQNELAEMRDRELGRRLRAVPAVAPSTLIA